MERGFEQDSSQNASISPEIPEEYDIHELVIKTPPVLCPNMEMAKLKLLFEGKENRSIERKIANAGCQYMEYNTSISTKEII